MIDTIQDQFVRVVGGRQEGKKIGVGKKMRGRKSGRRRPGRGMVWPVCTSSREFPIEREKRSGKQSRRSIYVIPISVKQEGSTEEFHVKRESARSHVPLA